MGYSCILISFIIFVCSLGCDPKKADSAKESDAPEASRPAASVKGDPAAGKEIYEKYCFYCHGRDGLGNGAIAMEVSPRPANFLMDWKRMEKSDEELFKSISKGIMKESKQLSMPAWEFILTEKQRWDVLTYIRSISKTEEGDE